MPTTITIDVSKVPDAKQPVLDALDDILQSTVVPLQAQLTVVKTLNAQPPTQVSYVFPDAIPSDQVYNFYRRVALEKGLLSTKTTENAPAGIPQALSFTGSEVAAYGQPT